MAEHHDLIDVLTQIQRAGGMTDAAFAARLGIKRVTWTRARGRSNRPGRKVIEGAARAFPHLNLAFLLSKDAPRITEPVSESTEEVA